MFGFQGSRSRGLSSDQHTGALSHSHLMEPTLSDLPKQKSPSASMHAGNASGSPTSTDYMSVVSGSAFTGGGTGESNNPFEGNVNPFSLGVVNPLFNPPDGVITGLNANAAAGAPPGGVTLPGTPPGGSTLAQGGVNDAPVARGVGDVDSERFSNLGAKEAS